MWSQIPGPNKCKGTTEKFVEALPVTKILKDNKCYEQKDGMIVTAQNLIINRITPYPVDTELLANLTICRFHKVRASYISATTIKLYLMI